MRFRYTPRRDEGETRVIATKLPWDERFRSRRTGTGKKSIGNTPVADSRIVATGILTGPDPGGACPHAASASTVHRDAQRSSFHAARGEERPREIRSQQDPA